MNTGLNSRGEGAGLFRRVRPWRRSTPEKLEAVKAILSGKASVDAVAQKFGVKAETVAQWRDQALSALEAWMKEYNEVRPHQALGWQTPAQRRAQNLSAAWKVAA